MPESSWLRRWPPSAAVGPAPAARPRRRTPPAAPRLRASPAAVADSGHHPNIREARRRWFISAYPEGVPDTGFPTQDAQTDFSRARRRQQLARLAARLRREPDDVGLILPFDEVVEALGRRGERRLGLQTIDLDSIVGTVDRSRREFDRSFRPTSHRVRRRWQRIATAMRRGDAMPPIDVYRVGDAALRHRRPPPGLGRPPARAREDRRDGDRDHHRGRRRARGSRSRDLPLKTHERMFFERVPLPPRDARADLALERLRLRRARRGGRGLGLPADAGARASSSPARRSPRPGSARSTSR